MHTHISLFIQKKYFKSQFISCPKYVNFRFYLEYLQKHIKLK